MRVEVSRIVVSIAIGHDKIVLSILKAVRCDEKWKELGLGVTIDGKKLELFSESKAAEAVNKVFKREEPCQ